MKTSMAYRLFRLYFNSHADDYALFGSRVNNPMNGKAEQGNQQVTAAWVRFALAAAALGALAAITIL